jgi:dTDP-4-dehydrorhamnose reductase
MSNHLVVGIQGIVGSALFAHLESKGVAVWGTTRRRGSEKRNVFYLDLLDAPHQWEFPDVQFDTVYLCAGICRMALCEDDPDATSQVNIDGMMNLVRYLSQQGAFIIFLSTNQVFSGEKPFVSATANYQPLNEYGRQKAVVESMIQSVCSSWGIVRLTKVVEPNMLLIQNWIDRLIQRQTVDAFHDMMLAPVTLMQVIEVLTRLGQLKKSGCYHLSGAKDISYYDLAIYLAHCLKCPEQFVQSISAISKGIKKIFLPQFTTLDCSSTIDVLDHKPLLFSEVVQECFDLRSFN